MNLRLYAQTLPRIKVSVLLNVRARASASFCEDRPSKGRLAVFTAGRYAVGDGSDAGSRDERVVNDCLQDEVLLDDGTCEHVGPSEEACQSEGFTVAADGACSAVLPEADCEDGLAYRG